MQFWNLIDSATIVTDYNSLVLTSPDYATDQATPDYLIHCFTSETFIQVGLAYHRSTEKLNFDVTKSNSGKYVMQLLYFKFYIINAGQLEIRPFHS